MNLLWKQFVIRKRKGQKTPALLRDTIKSMQLRLGKSQKIWSAVSKSETVELYFIPPRTMNVVTQVKLLQVKLHLHLRYFISAQYIFIMVFHATVQNFWIIESSWEIVKNSFRKTNFNYRSRENKCGLLTETISFSVCLSLSLSAFNQQSNIKRSYKILTAGLFGLK